MAIVNTKSNEVSQIATDSYQILKHRDFFRMMTGELESLGLTDVSDSHGLDRVSAWKKLVSRTLSKVQEGLFICILSVDAHKEQVDRQNEVTQKQVVHIHSLIQESSKLNTKLLPKTTVSKKSWWKFC